MALVANGVKVSLPSGIIPSGASAQSVTTFTDHEYTRDITLEVLKSTVESATKATTFDNIINDATIGIKKQIADILGADYDDAVLTVTYYIDYLSITSNIVTNVTSDFYSNVATKYLCTVKLYVKTN